MTAGSDALARSFSQHTNFESDFRCTPIVPTTAAQLREADVGERVQLSGWVHRKRDHGGVLFVDLRDHYGLTQIVSDARREALKALEAAARRIGGHDRRARWSRRGAEAINPNLPTGEIEILADEVDGPVGRAEELPLPVAGEPGISRGYPPPLPLSSTCGASGCTPTSCCAAR